MKDLRQKHPHSFMYSERRTDIHSIRFATKRRSCWRCCELFCFKVNDSRCNRQAIAKVPPREVLHSCGALLCGRNISFYFSFHMTRGVWLVGGYLMIKKLLDEVGDGAGG